MSQQLIGKLEKVIQKTVRLNYLLYLPEEYESSGETQWPLVLFLHGMGERGDDVMTIKKHGLPKLADQRKFPFVIVSPQCPPHTYWTAEIDGLKALVEEIADRYRIDRKRIYVTGLSMGGFGTWELASSYPNLFAAIAPICGGGTAAKAAALKDVPVWAFHGAKDDVVPLSASEKMVQAVNAAGGNAKLTVYPDLDHDSWTVTYDNPELYEWLLKRVRP